MDPISLSSGIAGLITLALQVGSTIAIYVSAVKDKPNNVNELYEELSLLGTVLSNLRDFLKAEEKKGRQFDEGAVLRKAMVDCTRRIERIGDRLKPPGGGRITRAIDRLKWPFERGEILQLVESLRRYTNTFQFAVSVHGCNILSKTSDDAAESLKTTLELTNKMSETCAQLDMSTEEYQKKSQQIEQILDFMPTLLQQADDVKEVSQAMRLAEQREHERRKTDILEWLAPISSMGKHADVQKRRATGTCVWLSDNSDFQQWATLDNSPHDLLCVGPPGAGKTVLSSFVFDHLRGTYKESDIAIIHYYCDHFEEQTQTSSHLVRCLLRQLCQTYNGIPSALVEFYQSTKNDIKDNLWFYDLQGVFKRVLDTFENIFILIDALDEANSKDQRNDFLGVLDLVKTSKTATRIFATARPHVSGLHDRFTDLVTIECRANEVDMQQFLKTRIEKSLDSRDILDLSLQSEIIRKLVSNANGIFLLPALQIDNILDQVTKADVRRALASLSADLEEVFQSTINRIRSMSSQRKDLAFKTMMWISNARRALTVSELQHALAVRFEDDQLDKENIISVRTILDSCCGLVELDKDRSKVRFVHFSMEEYLRKEDHDYFENGELTVTRICLKYLLQPSLKSLTSQNRDEFLHSLENDLCFLDYASHEWGRHAARLQIEEYQDLAVELLDNKDNLLAIARVRDKNVPDFRKWKARMTIWAISSGAGISVAASFGLTELIRVLLSQSPKLSLRAKTMHGNTPLHESAMLGYDTACEILIAHGADLLDKNTDGATPFYLAVSNEQMHTARTLLKYHRVQIDTHCKFGFTALHKAADMGYIAMVEFLLQSGALVAALDDKGHHPLHLAARRGYFHVVHLLVLAGAQVHVEADSGDTPLSLAATGGYTQLVEFLIDQGAIISHKGPAEWGPLHHAVRRGNSETVLILLRRGANVRDTGRRNINLLHLAVRSGDLATVKIILHHDPEYTITQLRSMDKKDATAKTVAFFTANYGIYKYLRDLERDLLADNPNQVQIYDPLQPMTVAIEMGDLQLVQTILASTPEFLSQRDPSGQAALHTAFIECNQPIATYLLDQGADINMLGFHGWTSLQIAASIGSLEMLDLALSRGANIHAVSSTRQTALHKACSSRSMAILTRLLSSGANPRDTNDRGMTALHIAAHQNFLDGVRELVHPQWAAQDLVLARDSVVGLPRHWAERSGYWEVVVFLQTLENSHRSRSYVGKTWSQRQRQGHVRGASSGYNSSAVNSAPSTPQLNRSVTAGSQMSLDEDPNPSATPTPTVGEEGQDLRRDKLEEDLALLLFEVDAD